MENAEPSSQTRRYPLAIRAQVLTLLFLNVSGADIQSYTGVPRRTQLLIQKRAKERGYNPDGDPRILDEYLVDGVRTGRPKGITQKQEDQVLANVRPDRSGKEKSSDVLAYEVGVSQLVHSKTSTSNARGTGMVRE